MTYYDGVSSSDIMMNVKYDKNVSWSDIMMKEKYNRDVSSSDFFKKIVSRTNEIEILILDTNYTHCNRIIHSN